MGSKVTTPSTTSWTETELQNFIAWVEKAQVGKINVTFSNMDNTSEPKIQAGSIVEIAGALYKFDSEEAATGWSSISNSTQAYMKLVTSSTSVSAEWTTTAPTFRDDLQGWYESGETDRYVLRCYKNHAGNYDYKYKLPQINSNNYLDGKIDNIEFKGNDFIFNGDSFRLFPLGVILDSFSSPDTAPSSVTIDPSTGNLISCDSGTDTIYIHDGITSTTTSSFASPISTPSDVTVDESTGNLLSSYSSGKVYVHDGITSTILTSYSIASPTGVVVDPTGNMITSDASSASIYVYDEISGDLLKSIDSPSTTPLGVTINHSTGSLISCDSNTDKIYVHASQVYYY